MRISLATSIVALAVVLGPMPLYDFDLRSAAIPAGFTFSRPSSATDIVAGVLTVYAADQPRISLQNGLYIEGAGTNNVGYQCLNQSGGAVALSGSDPLGGSLAYVLTANTTTAAHAATLATAYAPPGATATTISIFVQYINTQFVQLLVPGGHGAVNCYVNFDIINGTITAQGAGATYAKITPLSGGWYRISMGFVTVASPTSNAPIILAMLQTGTDARYPSFTGAGTEQVRMAFPQQENTLFLSSYIPSGGTTSAATRAAETCTATLANLDSIRSIFTEFTRVSDIDPAASQAQRAVQIDDGTSNNRHIIGVSQTGASIVSSTITAGATVAALTVASAGLTTYRTAYRTQTNDNRAAVLGTLSVQDASVTLPTGMTTVRIGHSHTGGGEMFGYIRRVRMWSAAMTDAELQVLST